MATFSIENFGCRATEADATSLRQSMLGGGFVPAPDHASADVVLLNTCTVTAAADSQARDAVRKIHRANPAARIVVTGCYAQRAPEELAALEGVEWVIGNSHQAEIPRAICEILPFSAPPPRTGLAADFVPLEQFADGDLLARGPAKILTGDIFAEIAIPLAPAPFLREDRTRPILKIQDGCNNRCAYCVIPFVRGRSRSLPPDGVVEQARKLAEAGAQEIVLSGINLGSYGRDLTPRAELACVVRRILAETHIARLRFSSIEPQDITEEFVSLVADSECLARHFHVPLQSGSNRILRRMRRWYRAEHYAERIKLISSLLPDSAIGADVIVGFPGESDEDFGATAALIERLPFTYLHVFSFSLRPGTEMAACRDAVPGKIVRERARALRALGQMKASAFRASQAGRTLRALTLHRQGNGWTKVITGNYLKLRVPGKHPANEWRDVCVTA